MDLDSKNNHNFDLLINIARNYFSQSQDKYSQINAYIFLIKILNYLKDINEKDENYLEYKIINKKICDLMKVNEHNEKVLILITNRSYHLISQIIKFSKNNKFEEIQTKEVKKERTYSLDYDNKTDKILSDLVKCTSISKIFDFTKNNRNIQNLSKFLNILSDLDKSKIKYMISSFHFMLD